MRCCDSSDDAPIAMSCLAVSFCHDGCAVCEYRNETNGVSPIIMKDSHLHALVTCKYRVTNSYNSKLHLDRVGLGTGTFFGLFNNKLTSRLRV